MKKFVVAILSYFDNENKMFLIEAENSYEAVKKAMVENASEDYKKDEVKWQSEEDYPKDYDSLVETLYGADFSVGCIEI